MTVVYIDSVLVLNTLIDYLVLAAAAYLAGLPVRRARWLAAAGLGGVYAAAVFLPDCAWLASWPCKAAAGAAMAAAAYGRRHFVRRCLLLFGVSCGFAGLVLALSMLTGGGIPCVNGIFYTDISFRVLLISAGAAYLGLSVVFRACAGHGLRREFAEVTVFLNGRRASLRTLLDTGNALRDPVTGRQVLVADFEQLLSLWPPEVRACLTRQAVSAPAGILETLNARSGPVRFYLTPYSAVGVSGGLLLTFRCDRAETGGRCIGRLPVALSPTALGTGFAALWGGEERSGQPCGT